MPLLNRHFSLTPWKVILAFFPLVALVAFGVYFLTLVHYVFPGDVSLYTAQSVDLAATADLSRPFFHWAARSLGSLDLCALPFRLNLFSAISGALAVALFYLAVSRLIFGFSVEDPGGAMHAFPQDEDGPGDSGEGTLFGSLPRAVGIHNRHTLRASVIGGLAAAFSLAFTVPFWISATRLLPHCFDLALFLLLVNLVVDFEQRRRRYSLFLATFLSALFAIETPFFMLFFPISIGIMFRSIIVEEEADSFSVLMISILSVLGVLLSWGVLWITGLEMQFPPLGNKALLFTFMVTMRDMLISWIPQYSWVHSVVLLLLPSVFALGLFPVSLRRRKISLLVFQILLALLLIPDLLNFDFSLWGGNRYMADLPVPGYLLLSLYTGFLVASWNLMGECRILRADLEQASEQGELDFYEYQDNPIAATIGYWLGFLFLLVLIWIPFRSFIDINPKSGEFSDCLVSEMARDLHDGDWLINTHVLRYPLILKGYLQGKCFTPLNASSDPWNPQISSALPEKIKEDKIFEPFRPRLLNMADLSNASFLHAWQNLDPEAHKRWALFSDSKLIRKSGYISLPAGFFVRSGETNRAVDVRAMLRSHQALTERVKPLLLVDTPDRERLFVETRRDIAAQFAKIGNELGCLLASEGLKKEAFDLFGEMRAFDPENLSLLFNRYQLAVFSKVARGEIRGLQASIKEIPKRVNTFMLAEDKIQTRYGTLIDPEILSHIRRNLWIKGMSFRMLLAASPSRSTNPLSALRDKTTELEQLVTKALDRNQYDEAQRFLDILLDLDDHDPFVMVNKVRIALQQKNITEAGVWLDLAKEGKVPPDKLLWHEIEILYQTGKVKEAKEALNRELPSHIDNIYLWGIMAKILINEKRYDELQNRVYPAMRNITAQKEHYLFYYVRAVLLEQAKSISSARRSYLLALQLNPHLDEVRERLLLLDDQLGVPAFYEEDAKAILRLNQNHAFANALFGMSRIHSGRYRLAQDLFERSLAANPDQPLALAGSGAVALGEGNTVLAENLLRRSLSLDPKRLFTRHELAKVYLKSGRLELAEQSVADILKTHPDSVEAKLTRVRVLIAQNRLEEAAVHVSTMEQEIGRYQPVYQKQITELGRELIKGLDL